MLSSCLGNTREIVLARLDKPPEDVLGTLRPAERIKTKFTYYDGKENVTGIIQGGVGPEYILQFESDYVNQLRDLQKFNALKKYLKKMVEDKVITREQYDGVLNSMKIELVLEEVRKP